MPIANQSASTREAGYTSRDRSDVCESTDNYGQVAYLLALGPNVGPESQLTLSWCPDAVRQLLASHNKAELLANFLQNQFY